MSRQMRRDESTMSLILSGQRRASPEEIKMIADLLLVSANEVMRNLGIDIRDDVRRVPIAGHIGPSCDVTLHALGTEETIIGPADLPADAIALQWRTVGSALHYCDGWLVFISSAHSPPDAHIGKVAVCADQASGRLYYGMLLRGYKPGLYNVSLQPDSRMVENVSIAWCSPALWIKPN